MKLTIDVIPPGVDPRKFLEQAMHDCPDCQAARARGEIPQIIIPNESRQVRRARERKLRKLRRR